MNVSVIGLGKLGACMAGVYATKGHNVVGVDINESFVDAINKGFAPVQEKDLDTYVKNGADNLRATTSYSDAIANTDTTFIIVPTPTASDNDGFTPEYVIRACEEIGAVLREKDSYHLVVLTSTLLPGVCQSEVIPVLEKASGKVCGKDFGFCYSPEFIAIGTVVHDLLNPDFLLVGESDEKAGDMLELFYSSVTDNGAQVRRMSIPSAELTKISVNSFLTMKITYANMLTEVAEHIPGVNIDDVTEAIGSDKRIGKYYLRGGLGYGGPCFPRDNRAFAYMATSQGVPHVPYALKTDEYNSWIIERSIKKILPFIKEGKAIAIVGASYKPGTYFSEESQAVAIAKGLAQQGKKVYLFNPDGNQHAEQILEGENITFLDSYSACVDTADVLFLSNWEKGNERLLSHLSSDSTKTIIDPWRQYSEDQLALYKAVTYITYGTPS